jgi:Zn-dependent protease
MFINILFSHPIYFLRIVCIVIISITVHELAHGFAALNQGDNTPLKAGHMTPNPVVHMGWESIIFLCIAGIAWGEMPVNPYKFRSPKLGNILVSAAGPLSNLALGILCMGLLAISEHIRIISKEFFYLAAETNLMLFMFNLLPIPPLDGFHLISELFPELKLLNNCRFRLFTMTIIFLIPGFGEGLHAIADLAIAKFSGVQTTLFR